MTAHNIVQHADVVVVGGGIVGCATAYHLVKRGQRVMLLEKDDIAHWQSGRNWGFVRQQGRDVREMPLVVAANRMWPDLAAELGADLEWVQGGNLALAAGEARLEQFRDWLPVARQFGLDTRLVSPREIMDLIPALAATWTGGMYTSSDGHADPVKATQAFARAAERAGARILRGWTAQRVETTGGAVSATVTDQGIIEAPTVVCAAGVWSAGIARTVGLVLPQLAVRGTVAETTPVPSLTPIAVWGPGLAFRQRKNGAFCIAPAGEIDYHVSWDAVRYMRLFFPNYLKNWRLFRIRRGWGVQDAAPDQRKVARTRERFVRSFSHLPDIGIARSWTGDIDTAPDAMPVLGPVDSPKGFILATCFSGHGFALGPIAGQLLAELIADGKTSLDIRPFRFSRFGEGDVARPKNVI